MGILSLNRKGALIGIEGSALNIALKLFIMSIFVGLLIAFFQIDFSEVLAYMYDFVGTLKTFVWESIMTLLGV